MRLIFQAFLLILFQINAFGQVTIILKGLPENTPKESVFHLAGSHNKWQPNDIHHQFQKDNLGQFSITLDSIPENFEYKICRGSWTSVEVDASGRDIPNRVYADSLGSILIISVANWRDRLNPKQLVSTASANVFYTPTNIEIPQLNRRRTVRVYIPPNYSTSQGFPVIYMLDGQNIFDASTSFAGEWNVDETLDSLYASIGFTCIVVAIYHGDKERLNEYTPWPNEQKEGGDGVKMANFVAKELKPFIDKFYRTIPDRNHTAIVGSSLGGLMALYMALEYPNVFGKVGVFSPSLWWSKKSFQQIEKFKKRDFQKIYFYGGGKESVNLIPNILQADSLMKTKGFAENEIQISINPNGKHNEWFWSQEFPKAVKWFFNF
jgi:alpha-glucosidase